MGPLEKAKLRIAYRIEEMLAATYRPQPWGNGEEWDSDRVAKEIAAYMPLSAAEAEEITSAWQSTRPPFGPSLVAQLREAVGAHPGMPLGLVIEAAVKKLKAT